MLKRLAINALALGAATWILNGRGITLDTSDRLRMVLTIVGVALVFGLVNMLVKPIFKVLTGCLILLTMGLFTIVINAGMLLLTSWVAKHFDLAWQLDGWKTALIASLIVSVASFLATKFLD
jgi:putative membrane protein